MSLLNLALIAKQERKYYLKWILSAFCISSALILLEPFGTTFRNIPAILLAYSYGAISMLTLYVLSKYLKRHIFMELHHLGIVSSYMIWYTVLLTIIAIISFFYFGLWSCHCETEFGITLLVFQFAPRTFVLGGVIISADHILQNFHKRSHVDDLPSAEDIIAISSFGNYLKVRRADGQGGCKETTVRGSLKALRKKDVPRLFRCHRSHAINVRYVKDIVKDGRRYSAIMEYGVDVPVSISKISELEPLMRR